MVSKAWKHLSKVQDILYTKPGKLTKEARQDLFDLSMELEHLSEIARELANKQEAK